MKIFFIIVFFIISEFGAVVPLFFKLQEDGHLIDAISLTIALSMFFLLLSICFVMDMFENKADKVLEIELPKGMNHIPPMDIKGFNVPTKVKIVYEKNT